MVQLLTGEHADTAPRAVLNEIFELVVQQGPTVTKLKADTKLFHLVGEDGSQRHKYGGLIEEMKEVGGLRVWPKGKVGVAKGKGGCGQWGRRV